MVCPNINDPKFKKLVTKVGESEAYALWDKYKGEVPDTAFKEAYQKSIVDTIKKNSEGITVGGQDKDRGYYKNGVKLGDSVTTKRDKKFDKRFVQTLTSDQTKYRDLTGKIGTNVHKDLENIAKRILSQDKTIVKTVSTDAITYGVLENFINKFKRTFEEGTVFLTEQIVYDPKTNTPGTVDLIAISPDGKIDIYDWKTMNIKKREKEEFGEIAGYKIEKFDYQLNEYKRILRSYGLTDFSKLRFIPININYSKNKETDELKFKSIEVGDPELKAPSTITKPYLNPVPVEGETTGIEVIDDLINQLKALQKEIKTKKTTSDVEKAKRALRLKSLRQSILRLQLTKNFSGYIENAQIEFATIKALLEENEDTTPSETELMDMYNRLKIYTQISEKLAFLKLESKIDAKQKLRLSLIQAEAEEYSVKIKQLLKQEFIKVAKEAGITDSTLANLNKMKPVGLLARTFTSLSRIDHPIFRTLWKLINKANIQTRQETEKLGHEIKEKFDKYRTWAEANGYKNDSLFNPLIDKKNGRLIGKYSEEFYKERKKRVLSGDWQWIKNNSVVDEVKLKKYIDEQVKFINSHTWSSDSRYNKDLIKYNLEKLKNEFDIFSDNKAWLNQSSFFVRFLKPTSNWISKEYSYIEKNPAAAEFFHFFTEKIKEFSEFMPLSKSGDYVNPERFIPNVSKDLIERIMDSGGSSSVRGLGDSLINMFEYKQNEDSTFGEIDDITGEVKRTVPIYYTGDLKPGDKSYDLARILQMFGQMAYNYRHMSEIEGSIRNLQSVLADSKEALTDGTGKVKQNLLNNKTLTKVVSADTLTSFNDFVNYYVYGVKQKDDWGSFDAKKKVINEETGEEELVDTKISKNKIASATLRYFSAKTIGLNLLSSTANAFGGFSNLAIIAAGGQFFNKRQFAKSMALASSGAINPQIKMLLKVLNMTGERKLSELTKEVSVNNFLRKPSIDDVFVFQEKTDTAVYNVIALSMLQNMGIDSEGKVKRLDKLPEGTKALMDLIDIKDDGTLNLKDLISDDEFTKLRAKSQALGEKMIGMSSRDNVSGFRMTMFGQALMQFRGWIPRTVGARFGNTRYDAELEVLERGRYLSTFVDQLMTKRFLPLLGEFIVGSTIGTFGSNTKERIKYLYIKYLDEHPEVDRNEVTEEMFFDMHTANMKSTAMELILIGAMVILTIAVKGMMKGWHDDDDKRLRRNIVLTMNRSINELMFYISPDALMSITKGAVPTFSFFNDIFNFFGDVFGELGAQITNDEQAKKKYKPLWRAARLFPGGSTSAMWFEDLSKGD